MCQIGILAVLFGVLFAFIQDVYSLPPTPAKITLETGQSSNLTSRHGRFHHHHHPGRGSRNIRMLHLHDPLDCLSQVVCGLNTYPPQKPSVRTTTANDFAFLLKSSVSKLRSQKEPTTTTTTVAPATKRTSTTEAPAEDDDEYDDSNELDYEADDVEEYDQNERRSRGKRTRRVKRYSIFNKRRGDSSTKLRSNKKKSKSKEDKTRSKKFKGKDGQTFKKFPPGAKRPMTALDKLRMETDLRAKLLSDAQCVNGLIDHSCPFNYQQMLVLISSSLERERTISYNSDKVLPMVGYLLKSRNYTGTLSATFTAIEKINNYTIEADKDGKPIDFTHILDEVMNRETGDNGLRIVDTSNDSASASVWEDDEFDHILQNPYERKRPQSDNYKLAKKKEPQVGLKNQAKQKQAADDDDQSITSEEDTSEEGLIFDRARPPPRGPHNNGPMDDDESSSEETDVNHTSKGKKVKKKITGTGFGKQSDAPGPVFGFSHLQKSAEDE